MIIDMAGTPSIYIGVASSAGEYVQNASLPGVDTHYGANADECRFVRSGVAARIKEQIRRKRRP
ncbi:hypothetical protein A8V01_15695 [Novosphingobium guangzhouense]|uniref:Uncharacterized protein n=1 Tax=Novosphingobium guangzhouense TaxID=1850347 RepID=A0A2K2G3K6_9SPHN|nr:hypothetical protein A8V01_15695 [Novosphingobium guangzhouense]